MGVQFDNATKHGRYLTVKAPIGGIFDSKTMSVFIWAKVLSKPGDGNWDELIDRTSLWYAETPWKKTSSGDLKLDFVSRIYTPKGTQDGGTGQVRTSASEPPTYLSSDWHLYIWTYDGQVLVSYVDGKEITRKAYTGSVGPTAATPPVEKSLHGQYDINWGAFNTNDDWASVCVDDTVIFGRALTANEVQALNDTMLR